MGQVYRLFIGDGECNKYVQDKPKSHLTILNYTIDGIPRKRGHLTLYTFI